MKTNIVLQRLIMVLTLLIFATGCSKKGSSDLFVKEVSRPVILLNGTWKFSMNPPENLQDPEVSSDDWSEIQVPGECQMQAYAKHQIGGILHDVELISLPKQDFYYIGLKESMHFTNIARSLKENIYTYSIKTKKGSGIKIFSESTQACRFDKINEDYTLIIDDQWDYTSLLWGII